MLEARVLPKFNPIRAGFPVVQQGMGPNEYMFNGFGQNGAEEPWYKTTAGMVGIGAAVLLLGYYAYSQGMLGDYDMEGCDCAR